MFETPSGIIKPIVYVGIVKNSKLLLVNYKQAPNPNKQGWWIPAPPLEFGEDPQDQATKLVQEFGLTPSPAKLFDVESFVLPGGWHLLWHYLIQTKSEPKNHPNVKEYRWVTRDELSEIKDIAHGQWEIDLGQRYLQA